MIGLMGCPEKSAKRITFLNLITANVEATTMRDEIIIAFGVGFGLGYIARHLTPAAPAPVNITLINLVIQQQQQMMLSKS